MRRSHEAEEECLFFVALSRARTHLHLYRSRTTGSVNRKPSPFLRRLRLAQAELLRLGVTDPLIAVELVGGLE